MVLEGVFVKISIRSTSLLGLVILAVVNRATDVLALTCQCGKTSISIPQSNIEKSGVKLTDAQMCSLMNGSTAQIGIIKVKLSGCKPAPSSSTSAK